MSISRHSGTEGVVYGSTSDTGQASPILSITGWSLDQPKNMLDASALLDTNKTYVPDLSDISGQITGFWDDTETKLQQAAEANTPVKLYLYESIRTTPPHYHYGLAWVSISTSLSLGSVTSITANFSAAGPWGRK